MHPAPIEPPTVPLRWRTIVPILEEFERAQPWRSPPTLPLDLPWQAQRDWTREIVIGVSTLVGSLVGITLCWVAVIVVLLTL